MDQNLLYVYQLENGEETISFSNWVSTTGTAEDLIVHDGGDSLEKDALLLKYFIELNVKTVTVYEDGTIIEGPKPLSLPAAPV